MKHNRKPTETYWLFVADDGTEQHFAIPPTEIPTLRVEIVERDGGTVTERTWTEKAETTEGSKIAVVPKGDGWVFEDADRRSATWIRVKNSDAPALTPRTPVK